MPSVTALSTAVSFSLHLDMYTTQTSCKIQSQLHSDSSLALLNACLRACVCVFYIEEWDQRASDGSGVVNCRFTQTREAERPDQLMLEGHTSDSGQSQKKTPPFDLMQHNVHISSAHQIKCFVLFQNSSFVVDGMLCPLNIEVVLRNADTLLSGSRKQH